jgi:hypothetical protein
MNGIIGEFRLGEDIAVAIDAVSGDTASITAITASMKSALVSGNRIILDDAATAVTMSVAPQSPATGGWTLSLGSAASAALTVGVYGIDAKITLGSAVEITDQTAFIRLTRAALA